MKLFLVRKICPSYGDVRKVVVIAKDTDDAIETIKENIKFDFKDIIISEIDFTTSKIVAIDTCGQ